MDTVIEQDNQESMIEQLIEAIHDDKLLKSCSAAIDYSVSPGTGSAV